MKKRNLFTGLLALGLFGLVGCQGEEAVSSTVPSVSVPTTTPSTGTETTTPSENQTLPNLPLEAYYEGLDITKSGKEFVSSLSTIINKDANIGSYDDVWTGLMEADEDPDNKDNIICFYTGESMAKGTKFGVDRKWNREHIWAQAHGFKDKNSANPHNDLHHLRATEEKINNARGNLDFDYVANHDETKVQQKAGGNLVIPNTCFEPRDEIKGDVARMMFYMTTMYSSGTYILTLVDKVPTNPSDNTGEFGKLSTLLEWHLNDPVDEAEKNRNDVVYSIQGNRNPYIDHPEFIKNAFNASIELPKVDQDKVNNVIALIDALPENPTKDNKDQVLACKEAFEALSVMEKKAVTNVNKYNSVLEKMDVILNPEVPSGEVGLSLDFNKISGLTKSAYSSNGSFSLDGKSFSVSNYWYTDNEFRVGTNGKKIKAGALDSFGVSALNGKVGSYLEFEFDMDNILSISVNTRGKFDGTEAVILFQEKGSSTYDIILSNTALSDNIKLQASLDSAKSGRFVIVAIGEKGRIEIDKILIGVNK